MKYLVVLLWMKNIHLYLQFRIWPLHCWNVVFHLIYKTLSFKPDSWLQGCNCKCYLREPYLLQKSHLNNNNIVLEDNNKGGKESCRWTGFYCGRHTLANRMLLKQSAWNAPCSTKHWTKKKLTFRTRSCLDWFWSYFFQFRSCSEWRLKQTGHP